ncbi:MAG TPA: SRPBCC family protein [Solirubrobacteraceae bacterium]|jgi:uncharacterized membrane protein|nr:SRPBCC family protein [Solirubrobacteraceae bacterium]
MSTVHVQIQIDAPPSAVWDTVMDPNRLPEWVTIHRSVKVKSADPREEGARMDQVLHILGVSFKVHWTLDSVIVPREAEWHGRGPALSRALIRYKLTGEPGGPTTFDYVNEFHPPGGPLGSVASKVLIGHVPEREAHDSLARLKQLIESNDTRYG